MFDAQLSLHLLALLAGAGPHLRYKKIHQAGGAMIFNHPEFPYVHHATYRDKPDVGFPAMVAGQDDHGPSLPMATP